VKAKYIPRIDKIYLQKQRDEPKEQERRDKMDNCEQIVI
jgi:hypothetical protein